MCNFFSCIVSRNGKIYFCETDSHEDILSGMRKIGVSTRDSARAQDIVRLEVLKSTYATVDQSDWRLGIPEWFERNAATYKNNAIKLRRRVVEHRKKLSRAASLRSWTRFTIEQRVDRDNIHEYLCMPWMQRYVKSLSKISGYVGHAPKAQKKKKA